MAPRTGADGLIAPLAAKATSTRVTLVLVAAAFLAFSGCGGGSSSSPEEESTPGSTTAASAAEGPGNGHSERQGSPASSNEQEGPAAGEAAAPPGAGGGKHGPKITPPKGPQERAPSPQERAESTLASISLSSPALQPGPESVSRLPATYTCDGKDTWPALRWRGVPAGTSELILLVLNLEPVNEAFFFDWAVAGLAPGLEGLDSGRLPKGAVLGKNSFGKDGYSVCPPQGKPETIIFALYALPAPLGARKGFDPAALRKEILDSSGNVGLMAVSYGRG